MTTFGELDRAIEIIKDRVRREKDGVKDPLRFAAEVLSTYFVNLDCEEVVGFSEEVLQATVTDALEVGDVQNEHENELPKNLEGTLAEELYNGSVGSFRRRRGSVSAAADPFAPLEKHPKKDEVFQLLLRILLGARLITRIMSKDQLSQLVDTMCSAKVQKGERLITAGEHGKTMYLIESGKFLVTKEGFKDVVLGPHSLFGEIALLYSCPRNATVTCIEDAVVWVASSDSYTAILMANQRKDRELICGVIDKNEKFAELSAEGKSVFLCTTRLMHFVEGEIFESRDSGVFMVISPVCKASRLGGDGEKAFDPEVFEKGSFIGQGYRAKEDVTLLFIPECSCKVLGIQ